MSSADHQPAFVVQARGGIATARRSLDDADTHLGGAVCPGDRGAHDTFAALERAKRAIEHAQEALE